MFSRKGDFSAVWPLLREDQRELVTNLVFLVIAPKAKQLLRDRVSDGQGEAHQQALLAYLAFDEPAV